VTITGCGSGISEGDLRFHAERITKLWFRSQDIDFS
jgi:hypothetical protein